MSSDINVTYDLLFDILRYEKSREDLQKLDDHFFNNVVDYLTSKESLLLNSQTPVTERELTRIQLNNVKKILAELYERREKKIMHLAVYKIKTSSDIINTETLLTEEKYLFDTLFAVLSKYRREIINDVLENKLPQAKPLLLKDNELLDNSAYRESWARDSKEKAEDPASYTTNDGSVKSVRFVKPVPRFLGSELETYGPFEEQDIVSLPSQIANILVKKQRAEEIKID